MSQRNLKDVRTMNRANVFRVICEQKGLSRQAVADKLGLSKMSAVNIVSEYVEKGFLKERIEFAEGSDRPSVGRPSFKVSVVPDAVIALGVYISEAEITCSLINIECRMLASRTVVPTTAETNDELLVIIDKLIDEVLRLGEKYIGNLFGVGIASVGLIDVETGIILCADNFPNIVDLNLKQYYEEKLKLPVVVANDMDATTITEKHYGAAIDARDFLYIGSGGNSVGVGICINDRIYYGHNGFAGELGYTTINFDGNESRFGYPGQLASYTRVDNYVKRVNEDWQKRCPEMPDFPTDRPIGWNDIVQEAHNGNAYCIDIIHKIGDYLAIAIVNCVNIFDPEKVVLGGHVLAAGSLLLDYLKQKTYNKSVRSLLATHDIRKRYPKTELVMSSFGDRIMAVGSGALVFDAIFKGWLSLL